MRHISILVPECSVMQAIADPHYCFTAVNQFLQSSGQKPLFDVVLVGATREVKLNEGRYMVKTDRLLHETRTTDLVIVPALSGDLNKAIEVNSALRTWIVQRYQDGSEVASLCLGAFLLASTGLLDGKNCSTHWGFINEFKRLFPEVNVRDGSVVTEQNRVYTSGGANSYWNLLLYLVEKYTNRPTAILTAKYFAIDIDRQSQSAFAIFKGQKEHNDEAIKTAQAYIEANLDKKITVDELADKAAASRRTFERRFKRATNNTILEYIQRVKIEAAKRGLENTRKSIGEVMDEVGYSDTKTFRIIFKKITGLTPAEYRDKYNKSSIQSIA